MNIDILKIVRNRYYVNGIVIFILFCFVAQCTLQVIANKRWNEELQHSMNQDAGFTLKGPATYTYLSAFHVLPSGIFSVNSDMEYLPFYLEGFLFFILFCGLLSNFIQEKSVAIIRGFMGIIFVDKLAALIMTLWGLINAPPEFFKHSEYLVIPFVFIFFDLVFMLLAGMVILYYKQTRIAEQEVYETEGVKTISLLPASIGRRFLNHLLDTLILTLVMAKHIVLLAEKWQNDESPAALFVLIMAAFFIYFILTEFWFSSTPGKMFSSCRVIDKQGDEPRFFMVMVRTLCRFIPFDRFSFIFNANWHDKLSETYVVGDVEKTAL